jgi:hypothetical protein
LVGAIDSGCPVSAATLTPDSGVGIGASKPRLRSLTPSAEKLRIRSTAASASGTSSDQASTGFKDVDQVSFLFTEFIRYSLLRDVLFTALMTELDALPRKHALQTLSFLPSLEMRHSSIYLSQYFIHHNVELIQDNKLRLVERAKIAI